MTEHLGSTFIAVVLHFNTIDKGTDDLDTFVRRVTADWIDLIGTEDHGSWVDLGRRLIRLEMAHPSREFGVAIATGAALHLLASSFGVEGVQLDSRWSVDVVPDDGLDGGRLAAYLETTSERNTAYTVEREREQQATTTEQ